MRRSFNAAGAVFAGSIAVMTGAAWAQPGTAAAGPTSPRAIVVLDASGSMMAPVEGRLKIDIAREALVGLLKDWDSRIEVGLIAYGHRRKGDCADIEVLAPAAKVDSGRLTGIVGRIQPKGMTPLSDAVRLAAQSLKYTERSATVILISDGIETCKADPCAVGAELKRSGVDFRTHVIGFNVQRQDEGGLRCLANVTGGKYFSAKNAGDLREALQQAGKETAAPPSTPRPATPKPALLPKASLDAPPSVIASAEFSVRWTGPNAKGDYIAFVPPGMDGPAGNTTGPAAGNPAPLHAPDKPGRYDIVYGNGDGKVLARRPIDVTPAPATLETVETVTIGGAVDIAWTGPNGQGDFITIVLPSADRADYRNYANTRDGSPAKVRVPDKPGTYEIRYVTGQSSQVLARRTVVALAAQVDLQAPDSAPAGSRIKVTWTGPDNDGDFVTVVKPDDVKDAYDDYFNTKTADAEGGSLTLPGQPGTYELRYVTGQSHEILARKTIVVTATSATLDAPDAAPAGSSVIVKWTGPHNESEFITIVRPDEDASAYTEYFSPRDQDPQGTRLIVPAAPGRHELRYVGAGNRILARKPITTTPLSITLAAPGRVTAGKPFDVRWTGPRIVRNYLTIVKPDDAPDAYNDYRAVDGDEDIQLRAPEAPGAYELRYVVPSTRQIVARKPIVVE